MENEITKKEFEFEMNEYKDVMYIFVDRKYPPIDKIYLVEIDNEVERRWLPKSYGVQQIMGKTIIGTMILGLEEAKEFYNANYNEILESICPEFLLQKPIEIDGFYLDSETGEIEQTGLSYKNGGFGVTYSYEQAEGVVAFCELTQILPVFNEGWEPEWSYQAELKWFIAKVGGEFGDFDVGCEYVDRKLLVFKTKEKAKLFLKLKKPLISALADAGII